MQEKSMQEKESIMVVRYRLKLPSLGITIRHHSACHVMPNSYPRDRIFSPHLTTIRYSYNLYTYMYVEIFSVVRSRKAQNLTVLSFIAQSSIVLTRCASTK